MHGAESKAYFYIIAALIVLRVRFLYLSFIIDLSLLVAVWHLVPIVKVL